MINVKFINVPTLCLATRLMHTPTKMFMKFGVLNVEFSLSKHIIPLSYGSYNCVLFDMYIFDIFSDPDTFARISLVDIIVLTYNNSMDLATKYTQYVYICTSSDAHAYVYFTSDHPGQARLFSM